MLIVIAVINADGLNLTGEQNADVEEKSLLDVYT